MASNPDRSGPVPDAVKTAAAGRALRLVWVNAVGGRTYQLGSGADRCFVKWTPTGSGIDLAAEAARMSWAAGYTPVPRPLARGTSPDGSWLLSTALPGENAVADRWIADPRTAVTAIGEGLRALHEALPVAACPFSWAAENRVAEAADRAAHGRLNPADWHSGHQPLGVSRALERVTIPPPVDRLVVCHGDACSPNTLLTDDGRWSGHVDLGDLGIADRWADLAVATWSAEWNYGPGWTGLLLGAYGIGPDPDRTRYYRLLWDLGP